ncbi:MAG: type II toxin-antitoxin system PemK/MazF family toxin, partial [Gemmatimonadetes bacterium]|nr:type II toxin-antitoxin system PemK/MazF family toxin [Gemmatimonadota bacterium]
FPLTLSLDSADLPKQSWVKIGQVRTLSTQRIGSKLGHATGDELDRIIEGLCEIIGP